MFWYHSWILSKPDSLPNTIKQLETSTAKKLEKKIKFTWLHSTIDIFTWALIEHYLKTLFQSCEHTRHTVIHTWSSCFNVTRAMVRMFRLCDCAMGYKISWLLYVHLRLCNCFKDDITTCKTLATPLMRFLRFLTTRHCLWQNFRRFRWETKEDIAVIMSFRESFFLNVLWTRKAWETVAMSFDMHWFARHTVFFINLS